MTHDAKDGKCISSVCKLHLIALFSTGLFSNHLANDDDALGADARLRGSNLLGIHFRTKCLVNIEHTSSRKTLGRVLNIIFNSSPVCKGFLSLKSLKLSSVDHSRVIFCKCLCMIKVRTLTCLLACPLSLLTGSIIFSH